MPLTSYHNGLLLSVGIVGPQYVIILGLAIRGTGLTSLLEKAFDIVGVSQKLGALVASP